MAIRRKAITISINGAEHIELDVRSREASLTIRAYVRTRCGFEAWIARAREMQGRAQPASRPQVNALDRMAVTIMVTPAWTRRPACPTAPASRSRGSSGRDVASKDGTPRCRAPTNAAMKRTMRGNASSGLA